MTKSTTKGTTEEAADGPTSAKRSRTTDKSHLINPVVDLGDDDDEEDDYRPGGFTPLASAKAAAPVATVPAQQGESGDLGTRSVNAPAASERAELRSPTSASADVSERSQGGMAGADPEEGPTQPLANDVPVVSATHSSELPSGNSIPTAPAESAVGAHVASLPAIRGTGTLSTLPPRRPGRRRAAAEPFNPEQPRQRNQEAMFELAQNAPGYSSLLSVYSASQLRSVPFEIRNINLYGLTADQLGTQLTADKALIKNLTLQRPKLTPAHYVDAALEPMLRPFDPSGIDLDAIEDERDYFLQLAERGLSYRRYVLSDQESANLSNYRPVCSLRAEVNARLTRMMDVGDSIQGVQVKPFEIVSVILAEYLGALPKEREHLISFFQRNTVTTVQ